MTQPTNDILCELLCLEERGLCARLMESTMFVSRLAVNELKVVKDMVRAGRQNAARLAVAIEQRGGTPAPRIGDIHSGDLHFQDIRRALPRLAEDRSTLVHKYAIAAGQIDDDAEAQALLTQIAEKHQEELSALQSLCDTRA